MRDRLIELLRQTEFDYSEECVCAFEDGYKGAPDFAKFFVDHLIENGVIVPPCKVGDKLFALSAGRTKILTFIVTHLEVRESGIAFWGTTHYTKEPIAICSNYDIEDGTVFLTKEQAEKALAEVANGT